MSAVDTKDHLLSLINVAASADNPGDLIDVLEKTLKPILFHTEGFWIEARYCYKAAEIADRCCTALDQYLTDGIHHARGKRLEAYKETFRMIGDRYRLLSSQMN